jgi:microcystin-dependent protein
LQASKTDGDVPVPNGASGGGAHPNVLARDVDQIYGQPGNLATTIAGTVTNVGGSQPHENRQPFLTLTFCIALQGIFPSQT